MAPKVYKVTAEKFPVGSIYAGTPSFCVGVCSGTSVCALHWWLWHSVHKFKLIKIATKAAVSRVHSPASPPTLFNMHLSQRNKQRSSHFRHASEDKLIEKGDEKKQEL